jgi:leucyl/phenylalanyl-tRNA---protein transferase
VFERPPDRHPGDLWALGADLEPGTILAAYRAGVFPMPMHGTTAWWSPVDRAVVPLPGLHVSRSLRRSLRCFEITVDTAFEQVVAACADPGRPHGWIDDDTAAAYTRLHRLGWAHSIEAWDADGLAGGLYGVGIGGLFAAESKFHRRTDASKAALVALVSLLTRAGDPDLRLLDVQWPTAHLRSLGAVVVGRAAYHRRLDVSLALPDAFRRV